jgi:hypothetical protein
MEIKITFVNKNIFMYSFFWVVLRRLNFMCRRFGTHCSIVMGGVSRQNNWEDIMHFFLIILPSYTTYGDGADRISERSAHKIQNPGKHPEERIQYSEQGESFKSRKMYFLAGCMFREQNTERLINTV